MMEEQRIMSILSDERRYDKDNTKWKQEVMREYRKQEYEDNRENKPDTDDEE